MFVMWLHIACPMATLGTIVGICTLFIPGTVSWVYLNEGKPVTTLADKVLFTGLNFIVAAPATVGLIVRYRRRKAAIPKTPK
jgi:hypothetical protein